MNAPIIKPQPNEQILTGRWLVENGRARTDATCERIEWLIVHHLQNALSRPRRRPLLGADLPARRNARRRTAAAEILDISRSEQKVQEASKKYGASVVPAQ